MDFSTRDVANASRWLEAIWEPGAEIYSLPDGIEMLDVSGDGDARFIVADIGANPSDQAKVIIFAKILFLDKHILYKKKKNIFTNISDTKYKDKLKKYIYVI